MYVPEIHEERKRISGLKMPRRFSPRLPGASTKGQAPVNPFSGNNVKVASLSEFRTMQKFASAVAPYPYVQHSVLYEDLSNLPGFDDLLDEVEKQASLTSVLAKGPAFLKNVGSRIGAVFKRAPKPPAPGGKPPRVLVTPAPKPGAAAAGGAAPKVAPTPTPTPKVQASPKPAVEISDDMFKGLTPAQAKTKFREAALAAHPDRGGSAEAFKRVKGLYDDFRAPAAPVPKRTGPLQLTGEVTAPKPFIDDATLGKLMLGTAAVGGTAVVGGGALFGAGAGMDYGRNQNLKAYQRGFNYGIR